MSLIINTVTPEGIVFAADSRQSYRNQKGQVRIGSDSAIKLFALNERVGCATAGPAFLPENDVAKNISKFIEEFKQNVNLSRLNVEEIAKLLHEFFDKKYPYQIELASLPGKIKTDLSRQGCEVLEINKEKHLVKFKFKDPTGQIKEGVGGVDPLSIVTAGYNLDGSHQAFICYVPGDIELKRDSSKRGKEYGAGWAGQTDVVSRIVLGWDGRVSNLPFAQKAISEIGSDHFFQQLRGLEYSISWGTMTLQDAIDFSVLVINTTAAIQRFSDGIQADPGGVPGVGGPVDVAIITPAKGFLWVSKKDLKANADIVDFSEYKDLEKTESLSANTLSQKRRRGKRK